MDTPVVINEYCTNCALKFNNASQMFTNMTDGGEDNCSGTWEIEILDAIFYIYGFSARELAIAHLDNEYEEESIESKDKLLATTNYINEKRISLCSSCVSVFNKVYTDHVQFRKLSKKDSLLRKAIKRFSPSKNIKFEVKSEENGSLADEDTESLDTDFPNASNIKVDTVINPEEALVTPCFVNICALDVQEFNFDREESGESDSDLKTDPLRCKSENGSVEEDMEDPNGTESLSVSSKNSEVKRKKGRPKFSKNSQRKGPPDAKVPLAEGRITRRTYSLLPPEEQKNINLVEFKLTEEEKIEGLQRVKVPASAPRHISEELRQKLRLRIRKIKKNKHWSKSRSQCGKELARRKSKISQGGISGSGVSNSDKGSTVNLKTEMDEDTLSQYSEPAIANTSPRLPKNYLAKKRNGVFVCSCGKRFSKFDNLKHHELRNIKGHVSPSLQCNTCDQHFNRHYLLIAHKYKVHSADFGDYEEGLLACPFCGKKFLWNTSFNLHMNACRNENSKSIVCDKCGKTFTRIRGLRKHEEIHKAEGLDKELFKCPQCGIKLKHIVSLKKHVRVMHRNPKTFVCEQCGKTTRNMTNMRIHMKVHDESRTGSRPYAYKPPKVVAKQNDANILEGCDHPSTSGVFAAGLEMHSHLNIRTHL